MNLLGRAILSLLGLEASWRAPDRFPLLRRASVFEQIWYRAGKSRWLVSG
jgi:hypothetical protein